MQQSRLNRLAFIALLASLTFPAAHANDLSIDPSTPPADPRDLKLPDAPRLGAAEFDAKFDDVTVTNFDLWERIRKGFAIPDLNNPLVATHITWYSSRPE